MSASFFLVRHGVIRTAEIQHMHRAQWMPRHRKIFHGLSGSSSNYCMRIHFDGNAIVARVLSLVCMCRSRTECRFHLNTTEIYALRTFFIFQFYGEMLWQLTEHSWVVFGITPSIIIIVYDAMTPLGYYVLSSVRAMYTLHTHTHIVRTPWARKTPRKEAKSECTTK